MNRVGNQILVIMKKKNLSLISSLKEIGNGKLAGGFETIVPAKLMVVFGGEDTNQNCAGANCVTGCTTVNNVPGCGAPKP